MKRIAALLLLIAVGCSSGGNVPPDLIPPEFRVREISGQFRPRGSEAVPLTLQVDIFNHSSEELVLRRLQLQSTGGGAYRFGPTSRDFSRKILSQSVQTVDVPIMASLESLTIDPSTPVTLRGTAIFDSPFGKIRRVFNVTLEDKGAREIR